ncbi:MAG TPA: polyprenyl synthetase, partial [Phycisphaerae bacterium]|nr:polyprenyl synthetase [Phycisphaerae bacterium]
LQQVYPYMEAAAVPGMAICLLKDGCRDTTVDLDEVRDAIYLSSASLAGRLDMEKIRLAVDCWFQQDSLAKTLGKPAGQTEKVAQQWLARAGKRWRPFLAVCTCQALSGVDIDVMDDGLNKLAVAIECFHKASLIHDDIEDGDEFRYGMATVHAKYGTAFALNVGDFLLGEGYRLISECTDDGSAMAKMLAVASSGHRTLCLGQGDELWWTAHRGVISSVRVLEIFSRKTAPAFGVALQLGAIHAGADFAGALESYSKALGIAYQIRDDMDDFFDRGDSNDATSSRLSVILALACELAEGSDAVLIENLWQSSDGFDPGDEKVAAILKKLDLPARALTLLGRYKAEAIESLEMIGNAALKGLLRRVVGKIFYDFEIMGCCDDYSRGDAPHDSAGR